MSGAITSLGSSEISSQIATVEARLQKPITQLQAEQTTDKAVISAWGTIQGTISSLSTALAGIKNITTINNRSATSTLTNVATATATNTALPATYNLTAVKLAKAQEIYSGVLGSGSAKIGTGSGSLTITLKSGKTEQIPVGSSGITLNGLSQAINKLAGGVQASVIGTAGGARLVLQGSTTGSSQAFSVKGTGALAKLDYSSAASAVGSGSFVKAQLASNASFNINGVPVSAATNNVTTAVSGVTIALAGSGSTTVNVSSSPGGIANAVGAVATSLNAAIAAIAKQTAYVPASSANAASASSAQSGPLLGNYTASDLTNQLLSRVSSAAASGQTSNTIGLTVSSTGAVAFNSATFATAYAANPTAVTTLVNQIYKNLTGVTTAALGSSGTNGTISAQDAAQTAAIASLQTEITSISKNNAAQLQILLQEYTATEAASTSAQISQSYLSIFTNSGSSTTKG
jgi:flagellar hook-associated protein 2